MLHFTLHFTSWNLIPISWPVCPVDQYPFRVSMCLQCYQSDDSRQSHQRTNKSQILFQPWCHLYTRETTVDRELCPAAHQTKQVPIEILLHWLQPFVAYCKEMNQSILKFFHLFHIHGVKQQWTKNCALRHTRQNRCPLKFCSIDYNPLFPIAQKWINPY